MNLTSKISSVVSKPAMLFAYVRWIVSKIITRKPPRLQFTDASKISVGEWLSFSEYWSFQDMVPEPERLFFKNCLANEPKDKGVSIDVGANLGLFTLFMASMGCPVHAFEPIPETFCRLKNNVKYNSLLGNARLKRVLKSTPTELVFSSPGCI